MVLPFLCLSHVLLSFCSTSLLFALSQPSHLSSIPAPVPLMMSNSHELTVAEKAHYLRFRMRAMVVALTVLLVGLGAIAITSTPSHSEDVFLFSRNLQTKGGSGNQGGSGRPSNSPSFERPSSSSPSFEPIDGVIRLTDDVESAKFSVGDREYKSFIISAPSSSLVTCTTDFDNGDLYLLMNRDGRIGFELYHCAFLTSCAISAGPGGRVYAIIYGIEETSDFTVTCTISPSIEPIELTDDVESAKFSVGGGEYKSFFINAPPSYLVTCTTDADNGDLDLFMDRNGEIDRSADCESSSDTSVEACTISAGPGGRVYAIIFGYEEAFNITVTCTISPSIEPIELTDGVKSVEFSVGEYEYKSFFINVPSSSLVTCTTDANNGKWIST
jgi:hypothetical protein